MVPARRRSGVRRYRLLFQCSADADASESASGASVSLGLGLFDRRLESGSSIADLRARLFGAILRSPALRRSFSCRRLRRTSSARVSSRSSRRQLRLRRRLIETGSSMSRLFEQPALRCAGSSAAISSPRLFGRSLFAAGSTTVGFDGLLFDCDCFDRRLVVLRRFRHGVFGFGSDGFRHRLGRSRIACRFFDRRCFDSRRWRRHPPADSATGASTVGATAA